MANSASAFVIRLTATRAFGKSRTAVRSLYVVFEFVIITELAIYAVVNDLVFVGVVVFVLDLVVVYAHMTIVVAVGFIGRGGLVRLCRGGRVRVVNDNVPHRVQRDIRVYGIRSARVKRRTSRILLTNSLRVWYNKYARQVFISL